MSYEEKRVRVKDYGALPSDSTELVRVPSAQGCKCRLHCLAAAALSRMAEAVKADLGIDLLVVSGWRAHRWESRRAYEDYLIGAYGSVEKGRKWVAFDSPHETGLAMDLQCGGLRPNSATAETQRETPLHHWLVSHAWEYGWHPYKNEPWHWEFPVDKEAYDTGTNTPAT